MPFIGDAFSRGVRSLRIRCTVELCRGLAQRNKGRKTSYFEEYFLKNTDHGRQGSGQPSMIVVERLARPACACGCTVIGRLGRLIAKDVAGVGTSKNGRREVDGKAVLNA